MTLAIAILIGAAYPRMQPVVASMLDGDRAAAGALYDYALEEDLRMLSVEVGSCYMVKTHTHYYLGRVLSVSFAEIVLSEAFEVYDTGPLSECYGLGKIKQYEAFPKGASVSIPVGSVNGVISWGVGLPRR